MRPIQTSSGLRARMQNQKISVVRVLTFTSLKKCIDIEVAMPFDEVEVETKVDVEGVDTTKDTILLLTDGCFYEPHRTRGCKGSQIERRGGQPLCSKVSSLKTESTIENGVTDQRCQAHISTKYRSKRATLGVPG